MRPCLDCGAPTPNSRCGRHARRRSPRTVDTYAWQTVRRSLLTDWRARYGDWCPGHNRPPHPAADLTVDHRTPRAAGGSDDPSNLTVLCRTCNSSKQARH